MTLFFVITSVLLTVTLLVNRVGLVSKQQPAFVDNQLCAIDMGEWFAALTGVCAAKLLVLGLRYHYFKRDHQESIVAFFVDLVLMNALLTGIFVKGNQLYFDRERNFCSYSED